MVASFLALDLPPRMLAFSASAVFAGVGIMRLLTLLAVPVTYSWLDHLSITFRRVFQQRGEARHVSVAAARMAAPGAATVEVAK